MPKYLNIFSNISINVFYSGLNDTKNGPQNVISIIYKNKTNSQMKTKVPYGGINGIFYSILNFFSSFY